MKRLALVLAMIAVATTVSTVHAEVPTFTPKVTHVTAFKDGHTLVMASGKAKLADGWCRTTEVPAPVLGTFWGYAADNTLRIDKIVAEKVEKTETRPCLSLDEMIESNVGKNVVVTEAIGGETPTVVQHAGKLLGVLKHETTRETGSNMRQPGRYNQWGNYQGDRNVGVTRETEVEEKSSFVMIQTSDGVTLVERRHVHGLSIKDGAPMTTTTKKDKVRTVSLHVDKAATEAEIGLVYLQRGVRWIPNYRVELLDHGQARVRLQATVINDLADLEDVDLNLVVGVPSFIMSGELSPMALREQGLWLSHYFAPPGRSGDSGVDYLSNAIMSQRAMSVSSRPTSGGPAIPGEGQMEDLYLYNQPHFSLKKDARAIVTLLEVTVPYEDVYAWDVPAMPPREMWQHVNRDELRRVIANLTGAKAMHKVRLTNKGTIPWTTGPATISKKGAVLGQQLISYTSAKNTVDLPVTVATDLNTKKEETETGREPNSLRFNNDNYNKVLLHGKLTVTNFKDKAVTLTIKRMALGKVTAATSDGKIAQVNALESDDLAGSTLRPYWHSWPWWWLGVNSVSQVTWDVSIPAGKSITVEYDWHYYHR